MSAIVAIAAGVVVLDVVVLVVALASMGKQSDARLEAIAVRRWLDAAERKDAAAESSTVQSAAIARSVER